MRTLPERRSIASCLAAAWTTDQVRVILIGRPVNMATVASDGAPAKEDQQENSDHFVKCARRITSLLCGSHDVNGGQTVAEWERFLRSANASAAPRMSNVQQHGNAKEERPLNTPHVFNNWPSKDAQEIQTECSTDVTKGQHCGEQCANDTDDRSAAGPSAQEGATADAAASAEDAALNFSLIFDVSAGRYRVPHAGYLRACGGRSSPDGLSEERQDEEAEEAKEEEGEGGGREDEEGSASGCVPSTLSFASDSEDSWLGDTHEEEEEEQEDGELSGRLSPSQATVLGMLPAGYHESDDNLFGQQSSASSAPEDAHHGSNLTPEESDWIQMHHPLPLSSPTDNDIPPGLRPYLRTSASVISALECPVCFSFMTTPIWLCINGHNVCGRCQLRVFTCPVCRGRLLCTRNLALEAIANDIGFKSQEDSAAEEDSIIVSEEEVTHPGDIAAIDRLCCLLQDFSSPLEVV